MVNDYDFLAGEILNVQSELETQFGDDGITNARLTRLETALTELAQQIREHAPTYGALEALETLGKPLSEFGRGKQLTETYVRNPT